MIETILQNTGIEIEQEEQKKLSKLVSLFQDWNKQINLSSFNEEETIITKHIIDSLFPIKDDRIINAKNILDLGTGGGFPGLPLAIIFPEKKFTLVDSVQKKIVAVQDMADQLELKNVQTICERIETIGRDKNYREQFDIVTARALAKFPTMLEYALPCVKIDGYLVAYQTPDIEKEINEKLEVLEKLGGTIEEIKDFELPNNSGKRKIIFIKKIKQTPKTFPREIGTPKKNPL